MTKYAAADICSYVNPSEVRAAKGDVLTVFKVDGHIAYCVNGGVAFTTTLDTLSDEYVAPEPPKIEQNTRRRR